MDGEFNFLGDRRVQIDDGSGKWRENAIFKFSRIPNLL